MLLGYMKPDRIEVCKHQGEPLKGERRPLPTEGSTRAEQLLMGQANETGTSGHLTSLLLRKALKIL